MVYSVCSLEPEETDATVKEFLDTHSMFVQEDARPFVPPAFRGADAAIRPTRTSTEPTRLRRLAPLPMID
jgi:16S rRNA C967 or C1407 C5-methylase (RsmB/RsmF family)